MSEIEHTKTIRRWHDICALDVRGINVLECEGRDLFVVEESGEWRVFDTKCPHSGATLAYAAIRGSIIECSLHGWRFDLKNGRCVRFGTKNLIEFDTQIDGGRLQALW